ncbi:MAG TPA: FAD-binding oxidoreductase, partial [Microbacterium sp.]|nr:FAD-binding oxidoreductase [Microbacterium sp.]
MTATAQHVIDELTQAVPADALITDPASMDAYRWDRALDPRAGVPLAVVRPQSTEQVQETVRIAARNGVAIVPRGAGSG